MKPICDIVLLSYESPELLKKCVESVLDHTDVDSRLIIVDNNSRNRLVREYINNITGRGHVEIEKIMSPRNVGFAHGMNKGMRVSEAPFVLILNNDCVVTPGWLEELIAVAGMDKNIGLVNPQSSTFGSRPGGGFSLEEHALALRDKKGKFVELGHAIGFACLIKREVLEKIGYLDESYEGVCYEDTDFSLRAREAGYMAVMAEGSYVYHKEQASRRVLKNRDKIYAKNRNIFEKRWGWLLRIFLYLPDINDEKMFLAVYNNLRSMAGERSIIKLWTKEASVAGEDVLDKKNVTKHADIGIKTVRSHFLWFKVIWEVVTKKKRYDAVIMRRGPLFYLVFLKCLIRRTKVFYLEGDKIKATSGVIFDFNDPAIFTRYLRAK